MDHCHKSIVCLNHFIPIQRPIIINCSNLTIRPDAMSIVSEFGMLNLLVIALSKMFPYLYERYVAQYSPIPYINLNCYDLLFIGWLLLLMHYNRSYAAPYRDIALLLYYLLNLAVCVLLLPQNSNQLHLLLAHRTATGWREVKKKTSNRFCVQSYMIQI